jgi:hypothetical protein
METIAMLSLHRLRRCLLVALLFSASQVHAGPDPQDVVISMSDVAGATPGASGRVAIKSDPISPDALRIAVTGLRPRRTHAVFLAAARETGALPVQFLGEFTTDANGMASFSAQVEVVNAYSPANPGQTGPDGRAPRLAGVFANGGFNVPLDFIRIYQAMANPGAGGTVFTLDGVSPGGIHVLSTDMPIPQELPSAQFLYNIVAMHSGKCIGIAASGTGDGLATQQQTCGAPNLRTQLFRFVPTGNGWFQIQPQNSLKCIGVAAASTVDAAPVQQSTCAGVQGNGQLFQLMPMGAPGQFNLRAAHSSKCLDVTGVSLNDGAQLIQFSCLGGTKQNQLFRITRVDQ